MISCSGRRIRFVFEQLRLIRSVGESQALNKMNGQAIIISASGMCEAGRILHHLANNIGDPKNTVLFVGYCAEHTLGRKIMDGWKEVPILGKQYSVRARIREMDSFSGHADHGELLEYFDRTGGPKRNIILVHGGGEGYPGSGGGRSGSVRPIPFPSRSWEAPWCFNVPEYRISAVSARIPGFRSQVLCSTAGTSAAFQSSHDVGMAALAA